MKLHRTEKIPEWELTPLDERLFFQKIAAVTNGLITPGNIITIIGLAFVIIGLGQILSNHVLLGAVMVIIGRLLDVFDGIVADKTKTKSPLGELFDASADKLATVLILGVLPFTGIAPWWLIVGLFLPQLSIAIAIIYRKLTDQSNHPTKQGKLSMALLWIAVVGVTVASLKPEYIILSYASSIVAIGSIVLAIYALWQYVHQNTTTR